MRHSRNTIEMCMYSVCVWGSSDSWSIIRVTTIHQNESDFNNARKKIGDLGSKSSKNSKKFQIKLQLFCERKEWVAAGFYPT